MSNYWVDLATRTDPFMDEVRADFVASQKGNKVVFTCDDVNAVWDQAARELPIDATHDQITVRCFLILAHGTAKQS
jgi:hypothetical protein